MATLQLYLKGSLFQQMDITLPDFKDLVDDYDKNFEMNCELREDYVKMQCSVMRANYIRSIIKCQYEFNFCLVLKSSIGLKNLAD